MTLNTPIQQLDPTGALYSFFRNFVIIGRMKKGSTAPQLLGLYSSVSNRDSIRSHVCQDIMVALKGHRISQTCAHT